MTEKQKKYDFDLDSIVEEISEDEIFNTKSEDEINDSFEELIEKIHGTKTYRDEMHKLLLTIKKMQLARPTHILRSQEAANILGISKPYLLKLSKKGVISSKKVGSHNRFNPDEIYAYRNSMRKASDDMANAFSEELETDPDWN